MPWHLHLLQWKCGTDTPFRHLISIPPGPHLLSDVMISSPILFDPERAAAGEGDVGAGMDGEIDANMDPELAMVRLISLSFAVANITNYFCRQFECHWQKHNKRKLAMQVHQWLPLPLPLPLLLLSIIPHNPTLLQLQLSHPP